MDSTTQPAWRDNILACYPALLARLSGVTGVKKVCEAKELASLGSGKERVPLDGAVYVVWDGFTPASDNDGRRAQTLELGFSVILAKRNYTPKPETGDVGSTVTGIAKALQGFDPCDEQGRTLVSTPFKQRSALPIRYEDGFAFFPLRFTCEVAVLADT